MKWKKKIKIIIFRKSPSSQRVWIEINVGKTTAKNVFVALFTEGVD